MMCLKSQLQGRMCCGLCEGTVLNMTILTTGSARGETSIACCVQIKLANALDEPKAERERSGGARRLEATGLDWRVTRRVYTEMIWDVTEVAAGVEVVTDRRGGEGQMQVALTVK